jgi:hypothetical protein
VLRPLPEDAADSGRATYRIYDEPVVMTTDESAAKAAEELGYHVNELRHMETDGPAMYGATVTVDIAEFDCGVCDSDDTVVSREDSEWVCLRCGMEVSENVAETANERLEAGDFQRGRIEKEVGDLARTVVPN